MGIRIKMIVLKQRFDLAAFVDRLSLSTLSEVITEVEREKTEVESNLSRDGQTRFEQMRYCNSLKRLLSFCTRHQIPQDTTPKEWKALQELSRRLHTMRHTNDYPETFLLALNKVILPKDVFSTASWAGTV